MPNDRIRIMLPLLFCWFPCKEQPIQSVLLSAVITQPLMVAVAVRAYYTLQRERRDRTKLLAGGSYALGLQDKLCRTMSAIFRHAQKYGLIPRTPESNPMVAVTALRIGECLGLMWKDVDWKKGEIYVRRDWADGEFGDLKSRASKSPVEMHETLATLLLEWRKISIYTKESDFIFPSYKLKGKQPRLGSMIATDYVRPAAIKAEVITEDCSRFGLHSLRHGLATWLADNGTDPVVIQRMLRWSSITMLQRYAHVSKKARQAQGEFLEQFKPGRVQERVQ